MKKTKLLKKMIESKRLEFLMEGHNGISSKIVEDAGFKGIWGSSLTISASLGLRDNNEASWTQILDVVDFMSDCTTIPILLDGDTGFGNFNNVRRLVIKLEQRGVAGVCIEDKIFPKTNSFIGGEKQPLAEIEEFCGRIKAGKDCQVDSDFSIVARVEAFIAGWGLEETLRRAHAYSESGADAIIIHSKLSNPEDIFSFLEQWDNCKPVIIIPTMYFETPTEEFEKAGVSVVIWANHLFRASVAAMKKISSRINKERTVINIEKNIVPVSEIFRLQDTKEYIEAEEKYMPRKQNIKAVVLAASKGENFGNLTDNKPKCMLNVKGKTILESQVETFNQCNIKDISVVVGYKKESVNLPNLKYIENVEYSEKGILNSYYLAREALSGPTVITFGDILFEEHLLRDLVSVDEDIVLAVDTSWWQGLKEDREIDLVRGETSPSDSYLSNRCVNIRNIGVNLDRDEADGEWTGLIKLSSKGAKLFRLELEQFFDKNEETAFKADINDFFIRLTKKGINIKAFYFRGHWLDIDSTEDIIFAKNY